METLPRWKRGHGEWEHRCIQKGRMVLRREQMGLYKLDIEGNHRESYERNAEWELDEPGGCMWCGDWPPELLGLVASIRARVLIEQTPTD